MVKRFPNARGVKTSLVDSYLAINNYGQALEQLEEFGFDIYTSDWVAHQYGRAYLGLHQYQGAISAFEAELRKKPRAITYLDLATAYRRMGKRDEVGRVLDKGLKRYRNHFRILVSYSAHLIQLGESSGMVKAENILRDLLDRSPGSGRILQQLCKLLRIQHRPIDAGNLLESQKSDIFPERYRSSIYVEVLMAEERWENAITELAHIDSSDVHLVGQKKKVYLSWAASAEPEDAIDIAKQGVRVAMDNDLVSNVPLLLTQARLAYIGEDESEFDRIYALLNDINPIVSEEDHIWYWGDDL